MASAATSRSVGIFLPSFILVAGSGPFIPRLRSPSAGAGRARNARREYVLTTKGKGELAALRRSVEELHREIMDGRANR
jgi:hypothetical protein